MITYSALRLEFVRVSLPGLSYQMREIRTLLAASTGAGAITTAPATALMAVTAQAVILRRTCMGPPGIDVRRLLVGLGA